MGVHCDFHVIYSEATKPLWNETSRLNHDILYMHTTTLGKY